MSRVQRGAKRRVWILAIAAPIAFATLAGVLAMRGGEAPEVDPNRDFSEAIAAVARVAGGPPERCAFAGPDVEVCRWKVDGKLLTGERPTPPGGQGGVHLICELRRGAEAEPTCEAHALETAAAGGAEDALDLPPVSAARTAGASATLPVREQLADARTLSELSHLMGDVPDVCRTGLGVQTCEWRIQPHDAGPGSAPMVALRCALPVDGTPRAAGSCTAHVAEPSNL